MAFSANSRNLELSDILRLPDLDIPGLAAESGDQKSL